MIDKNRIEDVGKYSTETSQQKKVENDFVFNNNGEVIIDNTSLNNNNLKINQMTQKEFINESYVMRLGVVNDAKQQCTRATAADFWADANNAKYQSIFKKLAALDIESPSYIEDKRALKNKLPVYIFCGYNEQNSVAKNVDVISNGNVIVDLDGLKKETIEDFRTLIMKWNTKTDAKKLMLLHLTPSTYGLRVIFRGNPDMDMEENQKDFLTQVGIPLNYLDDSAKDFKRKSFIVPNDYIYYSNEGMLFETKGEALKSKQVNKSTDKTVDGYVSTATAESVAQNDDNVEINYELVDNFYFKNLDKRRVGKRHGIDKNFGLMLGKYRVPQEDVDAYYRYYISRFKKAGLFYADDPSDSSEGWAVLHAAWEIGVTLPAEKNISATTVAQKEYDELMAPYHARRNWEQTKEAYGDFVYLLEQIQNIKLPKSVQLTLQPFIDDVTRTTFTPAALFATYTAASTYLWGITYSRKKGGKKKKIALNTVVSSPFATGKSAITDLCSIWADYLEDLTYSFQVQHNEWYEETQRKKKESKDKDDEKIPEPENPKLTLVGGTITKAGLRDIMETISGYRALYYTSEADALGKGENDYALTSTYLRQVFDSEKMEFVLAAKRDTRKGKNDNNGVISVNGHLNYVVCGIPEAIASFEPEVDVKNGTASRQIVCEVEKVYFSEEEQEEYLVEYIKDANVIKPLCQKLADFRGHIILPDEIADLYTSWRKEWIKFARQLNIKPIDDLSLRARVLAKRIALTNHLIECAEKGYTYNCGVWCKGSKPCKAPKVSEDTKRLFLFVANFVMITQVIRHGHILEKGYKNKKTITYNSFKESKAKGGNFDLLDSTFSRDDVNELYDNKKDTVKALISRWIKNGWIEPVDGIKDVYYKK